MKFILLMLFSISANAQCFVDAYGNINCIQPPPTVQDLRNDSNSPKIYENGQYRGNYNFNQYDPNSVSNPVGRYGNPYSPDSVNNPYRVR